MVPPPALGGPLYTEKKKKISGLRCTEMFSKDIETDYLRAIFYFLPFKVGGYRIFIATGYPKGHLVCADANAIRQCSQKRDAGCLFL